MLIVGEHETEGGHRAIVEAIRSGCGVGFTIVEQPHQATVPTIWDAINGNAINQGSAFNIKMEPLTINLEATKLPAPVQKEPERGERYLSFMPMTKSGYGEYIWKGSEIDYNILKQGAIFHQADIGEIITWWRKNFGKK